MSSTPEPAPAPRAELPAAPDHSLGVALNGDGADFAVHAPHATAVDLCLLTMGADGAVVEETRIGMHGPSRGLWSAHVPGVGAGQRYGYRAHGPWNPHEGLLYNPRKLLLDPYARRLHGQFQWHESHLDRPDPQMDDNAAYMPKAVVTGVHECDWEGDRRPNIPRCAYA